MKAIEDMKRECHYSDEGGFDDEGNDLGSVDALIDYKNALEDAYASLLGSLVEIHRGLFPESYPAGHPEHDPEHPYWDGFEPSKPGEPEPEPYEWDSGTIEWVASDIGTLVPAPESYTAT